MVRPMGQTAKYRPMNWPIQYPKAASVAPKANATYRLWPRKVRSEPVSMIRSYSGVAVRM